MTLRKALCASPLAVLVAVVAHLLAFGFSHAPGTTRSEDLLAALAVGLGFALFAPFVSGFFERDCDRDRVAASRTWFAPLLLALAGIATFGAIEACEGHPTFAALVRAACASIPLAYAIAYCAGRAGSAARTAGGNAGAFLRRGMRDVARTVTLLARFARRIGFVSSFHRGPQPGRAPPILV